MELKNIKGVNRVSRLSDVLARGGHVVGVTSFRCFALSKKWWRNMKQASSFGACFMFTLLVRSFVPFWWTWLNIQIFIFTISFCRLMDYAEWVLRPIPFLIVSCNIRDDACVDSMASDKRLPIRSAGAFPRAGERGADTPCCHKGREIEWRAPEGLKLKRPKGWAKKETRSLLCSPWGPSGHRVWGRRQRSIFSAHRRSEERRVGKECRSRWSPYH